MNSANNPPSKRTIEDRTISSNSDNEAGEIAPLSHNVLSPKPAAAPGQSRANRNHRGAGVRAISDKLIYAKKKPVVVRPRPTNNDAVAESGNIRSPNLMISS